MGEELGLGRECASVVPAIQVPHPGVDEAQVLPIALGLLARQRLPGPGIDRFLLPLQAGALPLIRAGAVCSLAGLRLRRRVASTRLLANRRQGAGLTERICAQVRGNAVRCA